MDVNRRPQGHVIGVGGDGGTWSYGRVERPGRAGTGQFLEEYVGEVLPRQLAPLFWIGPDPVANRLHVCSAGRQDPAVTQQPADRDIVAPVLIGVGDAHHAAVLEANPA